MRDLNVIHAAQLATIRDDGSVRRGGAQAEMNLIADGAVAIRDGLIAAVGPTADVLRDFGVDGIDTIDATGRTVIPGLVECHSHALFAGERHPEYAERLAGASLAEIAARGGGIWSSVLASRAAGNDVFAAKLATAYRRILDGGVTTLEVKSGYGQTVDEELRELAVLQTSRSITPMELVLTFLSSHVVPRDIDAPDLHSRAERYTDLIEASMLPAALAQGFAQFHDVTVEQNYFTPDQALRLMRASHAAGLPVRVHGDAWNASRGWATAVEGRAHSCEHCTYTPDDEIREVGSTDTVAVLLPVAELIYMTDRRANARLFIDNDVPVAIATDYCSSIRATSLIHTVGMAAPWFRMTPGEVLVGATLNAAYSLGAARRCGSLDVGKKGDLLVLDCPHPNEIFMTVGDALIDQVVIGGRTVAGRLASNPKGPDRVEPAELEPTG